MRPIKQTIIRLIMDGKIVKVTKTKAAASGGRQDFSVGPYQTAVGDKGFAVMDKRDTYPFVDASSAADEFIALVGRDLAWKAAITVGG